MKYIIDKIEKDLVVCENQTNLKMEEFKKEQFPNDIKEGDCVILKDNIFLKDEEETESRKESIRELMKKLMKG